MSNAREQNETLITELCEQAGCTGKRAKIHFDQMVNRGWNPHPSQAFVAWWSNHKEFKETGIPAVRARNCKRITEEFREARSLGIA